VHGLFIMVGLFFENRRDGTLVWNWSKGDGLWGCKLDWTG